MITGQNTYLTENSHFQYIIYNIIISKFFQSIVIMGIPKFFRWLTRRYPLILKNISREEDCPPIDNLYLDLNGIVHNCIHGNDAKLHERVSRLEDFDEVWANIMKAIDQIVHTVKPRQVLFLAVDGVAPRAKMNQQRARRFRAAKDSMMLREQLLSQGKEAAELFDSNAISPGTKFMFELNRQLEFFVQYKINTDISYQNLEVVLSDSSVPGEGEHKMMDYIRQAKTSPTYDPNTRHCFYGADADLIMLSLLTHEPNFMIIREEHVIKKTKQGGVNRLDITKTFNFQLIFISLLREYFQLEYQSLAQQMKMRFDIERIIDDFVFFCFFIGNDFLPSLSALDIAEGSLDSLIDLYRSHLPNMTDYITEAGTIYWDRAEPFIRMLGDHEVVSFKLRIDSIKHAQQERIVSFSADFNNERTEVDRTQVIKNKLKAAIREKKLIKIIRLKNKQRDKKQKKFWLLKRFEEEDNNESLLGQTKHQKEIRAQMLNKFRTILDKQRVDENIHSAGEKEPEKVEEQKVELLRDIIATIKEDYFSDLNPDDVPDDEISDIDESTLNIEGIPAMEQSQEIQSKIKVQEQIIDKYSEANLRFMNKLISLFAQEPAKAKAFYYKEKLSVDVDEPEGIQFKKNMLHKYLEGLQWVLYYYYRGAQHWRWYYPYHYAPMISDIDENIVQNFLSGKVTIDTFKIDANCSDINVPYTPFQQLLSIMPTKSIGLLPASYAPIAKVFLKEYFPPDFDIDLNGRALPWEAACLIPFCDESLFIEQESIMLIQSPLGEEDTKRNQIYFFFKKYTYNHEAKKNNGKDLQELKSSIKKIKNIPKNYATVQLVYEYQDVGKHSFLPKLLPGIELPCIDFPSFRWIGAIAVDYDEKVINRVPFKRVLIKVPNAPEDNNCQKLEQLVYKFIAEANKEVFVGSPYQIEAFPAIFEDHEFIYTVYGDSYTNNYKVHQERQTMPKDKYADFIRRRLYKAQDEGFMLEGVTAFVTVNRVKDVQYDSKAFVYYKVYSEENEVMPLAMAMRRRDPTHYMNMNQRCNSALQSFRAGQKVICQNVQLFGVTGIVQSIDPRSGKVRVTIDKEAEEAKVHDPFLGHQVLKDKDLLSQELPNSKRYYSDIQIEQQLKLPRGVINKITSSFLVTFTDPVKFEKVVIDLGMNIKNFTKKQHIPDYVRFVADLDNLAENQFDDYTHNQHARGARHVRKHWEYSQECVDTIADYKKKFSLVFDGLIRAMKVNKMMVTIKDMYGKHDMDEYKTMMRLKEAVSWVEKQAMSHQPFVEMGFDALDSQLIDQLDQHLGKLKEKFSHVNLKCKDTEYLNPSQLYLECFPYWCQQQSTKRPDDYQVGDRVITTNSTKREYVPFGLRGTVVGHTNDKVIILFDEQHLGGNNIYGHCQDYKGGYLNPNYLINLTQKFQNLMQNDPNLVMNFIEQPLSIEDEETRLIQEGRQQVQNQSNLERHPSTPGSQPARQQYPSQQTSQFNQGASSYQQVGSGQQEYKPRGRGGNSKGGNRGGRGNNQYNQQPQHQQEEVKASVIPAQTAVQGQYVQKQQSSTIYQVKSTTVQVTQFKQEDDSKEVYQDLSTLKGDLTTHVAEIQHEDPIFAPNQPAINPLLNPQAPAFLPVSQLLGTLQEGGFSVPENLELNPDFQNLMNMMNTLASQLVQQPIFTPSDPSNSDQQQPHNNQNDSNNQ